MHSRVTGVLIPSALIRDILSEYLIETRGHEVVVLSEEELTTSAAPPDVVVTRGELLPSVLAAWPGVPVLALVEGTDAARSARCLQAGAGGVIDDCASLHDLGDAVEVVAAGKTWVQPARVSLVLGFLADARRSSERDAVAGLTRRELEILMLVGEGLTRREIARRLVVSEHTARTHVQNVLAKLNVHSQLAAAAIARRAVRSGWTDAHRREASAPTSAVS